MGDCGCGGKHDPNKCKLKVDGADNQCDHLFPKLTSTDGSVLITSINAGGGYLKVNIRTAAGGGAMRIDQTFPNGTYGTLIGAIDGVNTTFTVSNGSYMSGTLKVYENGQLGAQTVDWDELVPAAGTFTIIVPPPITTPATVITVEYLTP